jgi:hypothetical protein
VVIVKDEVVEGKKAVREKKRKKQGIEKKKRKERESFGKW